MPEIFSRIVPLSRTIFDPTFPEYPKTYGEKLRKARMDAGLQIKELAKIIKVDEMTIINWEKDRTMPTLENMEKINEVFIELNSIEDSSKPDF